MWAQRDGEFKEFSYTDLEFAQTSLSGKGWVPCAAPVAPAPTLEELKEAKKSEIEKSFEQSFKLGADTSLGFKVDAGREDLQNYQSLKIYMEANSVPATTINVYDGDFREITQEELSTIILDIITFGLWLYGRKWELRAQIDAATTPEEVAAVVW